MEWLETAFPLWLLMLCRTTAFLVVAPVFSGRGVPVQFKVGFAALCALLSLGAVTQDEPIAFDWSFPLLVVQEVFIGISLGFIAVLFFTALQVAGTVIDVQMGLMIANVFDPQTEAQVPLMGNFKYLIGILVFLSLNGHHLLLDGLMASVQVAPLGKTPVFAWDSGSLAHLLTRQFGDMFAIALKISAPITASLFLVDVGLGVISRTVPQMNVFVIGLPLKILASFLVLLLVLPGYLWLFDRLFQQIGEAMRQLLKVVGV